MAVRLRVDWIKCDGYGLCGDLVPDLIQLDEWRYPILPADAVDDSRVHELQRAIDCCPMRAITIDRGTGRSAGGILGRLRPGRKPTPG